MWRVESDGDRPEHGAPLVRDGPQDETCRNSSGCDGPYLLRVDAAESGDAPPRVRRAYLFPGGEESPVALESGPVIDDPETDSWVWLPLSVEPREGAAAGTRRAEPFDLIAAELEPGAGGDDSRWTCRVRRLRDGRSGRPNYEWTDFDRQCRHDRGILLLIWVAGTGKERVAVAVRAVNLADDRRRIAVDRARLVVRSPTGERLHKVGGDVDGGRRTVDAGDTETVPVWFEFPNERVWNRGDARGLLRIRYAVRADGDTDGARRSEVELPVVPSRPGRTCSISNDSDPSFVPSDCKPP